MQVVGTLTLKTKHQMSKSRMWFKVERTHEQQNFGKVYRWLIVCNDCTATITGIFDEDILSDLFNSDSPDYVYAEE